MRSPLEVLEGRFQHVLLTTYSFNLRFFERLVLHALRASDARNVVVFVDRDQLGRALEDRAPAAAGKSYHVIGSRRAAGVFHPKLLLAVGEDHARLCVSSANLTGDGQMRNVEIAMAFDSNLAGHRRPIHDAGELFRRLAMDTPGHTAAAIQKALAALPDPGEEESPFRLVHNLERPLIDEFPAAGRTVAVSPFVDAGGKAAARLHALGGLTVHVDGDHVAAPASFFRRPVDDPPGALRGRAAARQGLRRRHRRRSLDPRREPQPVRRRAAAPREVRQRGGGGRAAHGRAARPPALRAVGGQSARRPRGGPVARRGGTGRRGGGDVV